MIVNLGGVAFGGATNGVGVFNGQNIQNGWDMNSPNTSLYGTALGQFDYQWAWLATYNTFQPGNQPVFDNDIKNNASPSLEGP